MDSTLPNSSIGSKTYQETGQAIRFMDGAAAHRPRQRACQIQHFEESIECLEAEAGTDPDRLAWLRNRLAKI